MEIKIERFRVKIVDDKFHLFYRTGLKNNNVEKESEVFIGDFKDKQSCCKNLLELHKYSGKSGPLMKDIMEGLDFLNTLFGLLGNGLLDE